jgi:hypothetical protein
LTALAQGVAAANEQRPEHDREKRLPAFGIML